MAYSEISVDKQILIAPETARTVGCVVSKTGVVATDGIYVVKAGTPLYGTSLSANREVGLTISDSGSKTALGVLYRDVVFESGATATNGTLVIDGVVDYLKLDESVKTLITTTVKETLTNIQFVAGRAD